MNRCILGDNLDVLPELLDADSIEACVTDPPYGIGFMGREWDTFKPGTHKERLRPQWNGGDRQNPNTKGRARSPAISPSQIEYDRSLTGQRGFQSWTEDWAREVYRVLKPGAHLLVCGAPRSYHRMASGIEDAGFEIRDCIMWVFGQGFPKSLNVAKAIQSGSGRPEDIRRMQMGGDYKPSGRGRVNYDHGSGSAMDGAPASVEFGPEAAQWDGWGTALKPAWEPIIVARKPMAVSVAANVRDFGTGAIHIDACRVSTDDSLRGSGSYPLKYGGENKRPCHENAVPIGCNPHEKGRWPANLIHDGSDEVLAAFPDAPGQLADVKFGREARKTGNVYGAMNRGREPSADKPGVRRLDTGSAARFFYCAKTSRQDRNEGCEALERKPLNWSSGTQSPGTFQSEGADKTSPNNHPTVKPTALMRYLVRLVTPPGGTVLDPFGGSGSTGKACIYEGFDCVTIEKEPDYAEISKARWAFAEQDHRDAEQDNRDRTAQQGLALA